MGTSEQARADAMADAETLRWFAHSLRPVAEYRRRSERSFSRLNPILDNLHRPPIADDLVLADASALAATASIWHLYEDVVLIVLRDHIRAAFRAVPGLKG